MSFPKNHKLVRKFLRAPRLTFHVRRLGAYVPPHLRKADAGNETESTVKLNRRINGLFNKMAEGNIALILQDVESLYQNHRRHDVTSTLTTLIIENIGSHSELLDSYVTLYGCFVASLHHIIGIDFAAYFVQNVVSQYEHEYASLDATLGSDSYGKQCTNLAILISELYQFGVISCVLIYDIIRDLLESGLREFEVELLLKIVRASGTQLRKDDPSALKDIVDSVMQKIDTVDANRSSRAKFMLETLIDLKNNKMKRITQDQGTTNTAERLKKFSEGVGKRHHTSSSEPLRVSLSDLRSADTKGKWWLVGSAWGGDPLVEHQKRVEETPAVHDQKSSGEVLLEIARKQGMNTDIRRSIFAVIMSSEDYVDACERLSQLNLKDVQQREIMRVIVQCCGKEKTYNPYYTLVGQQLCQTSHSHKITLQYCLWDFLRELGETEAGGAEILKSNAATDVSASKQQISSTRRTNVARAYAWWVAKGAVTLAILKPLDFAVLQPETQTFLRTFFSYVFIGTQTSSPILATVENLPRNPDTLIQVFSTTGRIQSLPEGIRFCLRNIFRKELKAKDSEDSFLRWAIGIADDALQSGVDLDVELS
ncbi:MIF4G-domain-containing protein [Sistotremastrum niveocremeum HHB9708]|uniref:MIF4G-domain-containing protein n=1 Tax=Sistotremastrum niveocremeum HHB9708 TaxID=1314777 RepID=A0A164VLT1_9AGAM|nr:MIF4G-domain-containing protein [Sistotremastrum niveocremeum HHB9708]